MRRIGADIRMSEMATEIETAEQNVLDTFAGSRTLPPDEAQQVVDGEAITVEQVAVREIQKRKEARSVFAELRDAASSLFRRREQVYVLVGKQIGKRSYYVMQCPRCEGMFIGTSGPKGWKHPSGRKGSCSECTAGMSVKAAAVVTGEAAIVTQVKS